MEAEHNSDEATDVVAEGLSELEGLGSVLGDASHHEVGDVGHLGHDYEKVLLDIIGNLVWGACIDTTAEAEVTEVGDGAHIACLDALGDGHDVCNQCHHLVHVEFLLDDHTEQLDDLFLGLLAQAALVDLLSLVEALLEALVESSATLENVVELVLLRSLPHLGCMSGQVVVGGGLSEGEASLNGGGGEKHGHEGYCDGLHLLVCY